MYFQGISSYIFLKFWPEIPIKVQIIIFAKTHYNPSLWHPMFTPFQLPIMHEQWGEKEVTLQTDSTEHPSYHNIPSPSPSCACNLTLEC